MKRAKAGGFAGTAAAGAVVAPLWLSVTDKTQGLGGPPPESRRWQAECRRTPVLLTRKLELPGPAREFKFAAASVSDSESEV